MKTNTFEMVLWTCHNNYGIKNPRKPENKYLIKAAWKVVVIIIMKNIFLTHDFSGNHKCTSFKPVT